MSLAVGEVGHTEAAANVAASTRDRTGEVLLHERGRRGGGEVTREAGVQAP